MAEEGLDVKACRLVVRFDEFTTPRAYIQSRGRARHQESVFVHLVNRDREMYYRTNVLAAAVSIYIYIYIYLNTIVGLLG